MSTDKDSLVSIVGEENADFLEAQFKEPSEYGFVNKYLKSIKKQISLAVSYEKVVNDEMSLTDWDNSLKSDMSIDAKYKGYFVKGLILEEDFYELLSFLNCNNTPSVSEVDDALIYHNNEYKVFVNNFESDNKNIAILFNSNSSEDISALLNTYFSDIQEIKEMNDSDIVKLQVQDISLLNFKSNYSDYKTGSNLYEIQDSLLKTYSYNPVDYLLTLITVYRLKLLGFEKQYIDYIASNNRGFNILNSSTHIVLNKYYIDYISELGYIDDEYSITESGRSAILLLNYITPVDSNNYGNFYTPLSHIVSSQQISKDNLISITINDNSLFGIKHEFFVDYKSASEISRGVFGADSDYAVSILNSISKLNKARVVGYSSNVIVSNTEGFEIEICQQLFNTFNDDLLNVLGGLVGIKAYNSKETTYVNSLIYRLIRVHHRDVTPYVSSSDSNYVIFKNKNNDIVGIVKTKKFACQKDFIGTHDILSLMKGINKTFASKLSKGLNVSENQPVIVGSGFIEKAELSSDDFKKLLSVPFKELKSVLGLINRDSYFSELKENEIIHKIISERKDDYNLFESGVKLDMNKKLRALELIQQHYVSIGNSEKETYYFDLVGAFKEKIDKFVL